MSCFDTVPCHRSRLPDATHLNPPPLSASLTVCVWVCVCDLCWCVCLRSEKVELTHLMERNVQRRPRDTQEAFSALALIQTFRVEWWSEESPNTKKWMAEKKSCWCVSKRKHIWVRSSTCFNSLPGTKCGCASVCFWQTSLRKPLYNLLIRHG